jgi:hypothetical protein
MRSIPQLRNSTTPNEFPSRNAQNAQDKKRRGEVLKLEVGVAEL